MKIRFLKHLLAIGLVLIITEPLYSAQNNQPIPQSVIPQAQLARQPQQQTFPPQPGTYLYTVGKGETLSKIASRFMPYTSAIQKRNSSTQLKI